MVISDFKESDTEKFLSPCLSPSILCFAIYDIQIAATFSLPLSSLSAVSYF